MPLISAARLAQSAERKALNLVVVGSSPTVGVFANCLHAMQSHAVKMNTRGGTRTRNLLLRREAPYPVGHTSHVPGLARAAIPLSR